jgi:hypothetical protein
MEIESPRFLIVSMPKSGTHLLSGIISTVLESKSLPYYFSFSRENDNFCIQMEENEFGGNRANWVNFKKNYPFAFYTGHYFSDPELLLFLVRPGELAISHLPRKDVPAILDPCFFYIFMVRDIESIIASTFNTERKIVLQNPSIRDEFYEDINFTDPTKYDISNFVFRAFDNLVPLFLDMLYWQYCSNSFCISYNDVFCKNERFNFLIKKICNFKNKNFSPEIFTEFRDFNQTNLSDDDKTISFEDVKMLLDAHPLFGRINQQINSILSKNFIGSTLSKLPII